MWRTQTVMAGSPMVSSLLARLGCSIVNRDTSDRPLDTSSCPTYDYWKEGLSNYTNTVSQIRDFTAHTTNLPIVRCNSRRLGTRRRSSKCTLKDSTLRTWLARRLRRLLDLCTLHIRTQPQRKILQLHQGVPSLCSKHNRLRECWA